MVLCENKARAMEYIMSQSHPLEPMDTLNPDRSHLKLKYGVGIFGIRGQK